MRLELDMQPRFANLLNELGIGVKPFSAYCAPPTRPNCNELSLPEIEAVMLSKLSPPCVRIDNLLKYLKSSSHVWV
jgi:hypothetical protein